MEDTERSLDVLRAAVTVSRASWPFEQKRGIYYCTQNWKCQLWLMKLQHTNAGPLQSFNLMRFSDTNIRSPFHTQKVTIRKRKRGTDRTLLFEIKQHTESVSTPLPTSKNSAPTLPVQVTSLMYCWWSLLRGAVSPMNYCHSRCDFFTSLPLFPYFHTKGSHHNHTLLFFCKHLRLLKSHILGRERYVEVRS